VFIFNFSYERLILCAPDGELSALRRRMRSPASSCA
jgi:hypothetical protein